MRADPSINQHLNLVLKTALVAINQYFLHARMLGSWGLQGLELHEYQAAIRAMKHADQVMSRILSLEGAPAGLSLRDLGKLLVGENVSDLLKNDLTMEGLYRDALVDAMEHCKEQRDFVSLQNLESLHAESEHRIDWLRGQLGLIDKLGTQSYLESSSFVVESPSGAGPKSEQSGRDSSTHSSESTSQSVSTTRRMDRGSTSHATGMTARNASTASSVDREMSSRSVASGTQAASHTRRVDRDGSSQSVQDSSSAVSSAKRLDRDEPSQPVETATRPEWKARRWDRDRSSQSVQGGTRPDWKNKRFDRDPSSDTADSANGDSRIQDSTIKDSAMMDPATQDAPMAEQDDNDSLMIMLNSYFVG